MYQASLLALAVAGFTTTESALTIGDRHAGLDVDVVSVTAPLGGTGDPTFGLACTTLRVGVLPSAEVILSGPPVGMDLLEAGPLAAGPVVARVKVTALYDEELAWGFGVMPYVAVPGSAATKPIFGVAVPVSAPLPAGISLGLMPALEVDTALDVHAPLTATIAAGVFEGVTAYGEAGLVAAPLAFDSSQWLLTAGVTWALVPELALDAGVRALTTAFDPEAGTAGTGFVGISLRM